jgi:hypothetical protein
LNLGIITEIEKAAQKVGEITELTAHRRKYEEEMEKGIKMINI